MTSLLDHLDNSYSDGGDEDDHINRLFPKCKPRSSLQPFKTTNCTTTNTIGKHQEKQFDDSRASVSDCNLTNSNNNINSVNNNFKRKQQQQQQGQEEQGEGNYCETRKIVIENGQQEKDYNNFSFRCSNVTGRKASGENNTKLKSKKGESRNSRHRRQNRYNIEFVPTGESPVGRSSLISSSSSPVVYNTVSGGTIITRKSRSYGKIMECDTLDDNFDNGIGSSASGSTGSNGSAFSQCSSSGGSGGDKNNTLSLGNNTMAHGGGANNSSNVGLRDSRIEIAGGREIYSQNRIKAIRKAKQASECSIGTAGTNLTSTPSSQSQVGGKIRRKSSQNSTNPLLSPSSPVSSCNNSIWEPHHLVATNKKSFPFSSSSSSSSRGDVERDNSGSFMGSGGNCGMSASRHGGHGGHGHGYLGSERSSHSGSRNFPRHGYDYSDARKTLSLDGFDMMGNKSMLPQVHTVAANILTSPTSSTTSSGGLLMKETVFASEITCIEKGVEVAKDVKQPFIYETPIDGGGEIVFDDIEDQWGRRRKEDDKDSTFVSMGNVDKSQLNFLETLMRDNDEQQSQMQVQAPRKVSSNPSGYESDECASSPVSANNSKTSPNNGNKRLIGNIPIAEYEGSPKRYGLRLPTQAKPNHLELVDPNSPTIAHLSVVSTRVPSPRLQSPSSTFGGRVPGFPQRVDTSSVSTTTPNNSIKTILLNDTPPPTSTETCSVTLLTDRTHDHRSEPDGQLNAKLDRIMSTTGPIPSDMSPGMGMGAGTITRTMMTTGTTDTSPDDSLASQQGSNNTTTNSSEDPELEVSSHRPDLKEDRDDYLLYEFSETRKVLEEFFKPSQLTAQDGRLTNFDELDYTLRRQTGNSYVGQRLASESSNEQVEESPKKPPRRGVLLNVSSGGGASPKLISFQEVSLPLSHNSHSQSSISPSSIIMGAPAMLLDSSRDVNDNDVDVETASTNTETDLGDTEVGLQVGHSRNFTLSPETTDCDSNELESEISNMESLDYEASLHSSSRLGATMPVLEDGLSSGNVSDNEDRDEDETRERKRTDLTLNSCLKNSTGCPQNNINPSEPNPTLLLMKKQISEIEKEIKLRSQRVHPSDSTTNGSTNCVTNGTSQSNQSHQVPTNNKGGKHHMDINSEDNFVVRDNSRPESNIFDCNDPELEALDPMRPTPPPSPAPSSVPHHLHNSLHHLSSQQVSQPQLLTNRMVNFSSRSGEVISSNSNSNTTPHTSCNSHCGDSNSNNGSVTTAPSSSTSMTTTSGTGSNTNSSLGLLHDSTSTILCSESTVGLSSSIGTVPSDIQGTKDPIQLPKSFPSLRSSFDSPSTTSVSPGTGTTTTTNLTLASSSSQQLPPQQSSPNSEERLAPLVRDSSPVWVPRHPASGSHPHRSVGVRDPLLRKQRYEETPDDDADTDQETDRLLGQNRTEDDYGFYDEKEWKKGKSRSILPSMSKGVVSSFKSTSTPAPTATQLFNSNSTTSPNVGCSSTCNSANPPSLTQKSLVSPSQLQSPGQFTNSSSSSVLPIIPNSTLSAGTSVSSRSKKDGAKKKRSKEDLMNNPSVLIEGVLFRARYLGSTQLVCEGQPTKATRMMQAEEAVSRIKAQTNQNGSVCQLSTSSPPPPPSGTSIETNKALTSAIIPYTLKKEGDGVSEVGRHGGGGGQDQEDEDDGMESDEDSMDEDDYYRQQRNPVAAALGGSIVDNNIMALGDGSIGARRLSSSDMTSGLPSFNSNNLGGSLPHLSPPYGSALPGTMFRLRFVGSMEVEEEVGSGRRRRKRPKKTMVEEAVLKLKAPEGETQPSTEVDLFISTEKIMVLNTDLKEIMMDHALRTISYIADIGDLVVLMARRRPVPTDTVDESKIPRPPKMICHVFESDEAQYIAQSIGQAFQVAYMEFLKANGIEDHSFVREMDYQEVLNSQEIFGDELQMFAKKELQKEVVVPKTKGEILGVVIVESGWGSMLPTVVIANLAPAGAAARCGQLNIGDQIIAINGVSLVGLPLSTCQNYIKNAKAQTVVKLTVVPCPPVVEVKIKRPDTKYQLGFSVQNGVICSLLRGGIAERGGVRVGHRIIEINNQSVVAVPHEKIVNLLATSVGEINMKTMPTSMFRLLTGQENPIYI